MRPACQPLLSAACSWYTCPAECQSQGMNRLACWRGSSRRAASSAGCHDLPAQQQGLHLQGWHDSHGLHACLSLHPPPYTPGGSLDTLTVKWCNCGHRSQTGHVTTHQITLQHLMYHTAQTNRNATRCAMNTHAKPAWRHVLQINSAARQTGRFPPNPRQQLMLHIENADSQTPVPLPAAPPTFTTTPIWTVAQQDCVLPLPHN
jgi:hypothetical protein